jgi:hypothetical protein
LAPFGLLRSYVSVEEDLSRSGTVFFGPDSENRNAVISLSKLFSVGYVGKKLHLVGIDSALSDRQRATEVWRGMSRRQQKVVNTSNLESAAAALPRFF